MTKKTKGLLILLITYILSFIIGLICFNLLDGKMNIIYNLLICDCVATVFVFIVGIFLKSASVYDPYWSLQTVAIYLALLIYYNNFNFGNILFFVVLLIWAIRLTYNFAHGFNDISYIDWRYKQIKEKTKKFYQPVSLLGIHMVPTLIVFIASVPSFMYVINNNSFEYLNIIGLVIMLIGILLELIADINMIQFKKIRTSRSQIINIGLWKYSRHPNYLGEITFWYGVALVFILSNTNMWYLIIGAILNTLLFLFISIPLAENNLKKYKDNYSLYQQKTRMLLPIKK